MELARETDSDKVKQLKKELQEAYEFEEQEKKGQNAETEQEQYLLFLRSFLYGVRHRLSGMIRSMSRQSEEKIMALCGRVERAQDLAEFTQAARELRVALHEHLLQLREHVANYGIVIASTSDSRAAD